MLTRNNYSNTEPAVRVVFPYSYERLGQAPEKIRW